MSLRRLLLVLGLVAASAKVLTGRLQRAEIQGESMRPALRPGDCVIADRRAYRTHPPRPGDVVLAHDPRNFDRLLVKRVARVHADGAVELRGDNPAASTDSRDFGAVPPYLIEGRILGRYWPWPSVARRRSTSASVGNASSGG
ncbi:nickel-type superoxide dismutase maturation protease [Tepidiforma thermophila]|uniref:Nickel-type superoxide dismutase maturation protease n=1 Tax=Tepidiforma thermophila (strain KCTC 52669 / CGMCC 1.13589 / G233) TaxID=2761530 RepID=A0A2A9HK01_TEPT2|nr:nickel-type superoxide dismutase maturation protease [Tepidiforma thermophila]PFG75189.1 nickel-type superoxide dismutase maturation protease [Tepidiforma thermophila]